MQMQLKQQAFLFYKHNFTYNTIFSPSRHSLRAQENQYFTGSTWVEINHLHGKISP